MFHQHLFLYIYNKKVFFSPNKEYLCLIGQTKVEAGYSNIQPINVSRFDRRPVFLCQFCTSALEHTTPEVRETAVRIVLSMYQQYRAAVLSYLPPNDASERKNFLYKTLFDGFAKIDGKLVGTQARYFSFLSCQ